MMTRTSILKIIFLIFFLSTIYYYISIPREVLLSFDTETYVGDEQAVEKIMKILESNDARATFFMMGEFAERNQELVRLMISKGHEIACHSQTHRNLFKIDTPSMQYEIRECKRVIENKMNITPIGFRAPWRLIPKEGFEELKAQGFLYDASLFDVIPSYSLEVNGIKTSTRNLLPLDDYILLKFLRIPKAIYFYFLKHPSISTLSISFHPHIIMENENEFANLIGYYKQKNIKFLTHEESLRS